MKLHVARLQVILTFKPDICSSTSLKVEGTLKRMMSSSGQTVDQVVRRGLGSLWNWVSYKMVKVYALSQLTRYVMVPRSMPNWYCQRDQIQPLFLEWPRKRVLHWPAYRCWLLVCWIWRDCCMFCPTLILTRNRIRYFRVQLKRQLKTSLFLWQCSLSISASSKATRSIWLGNLTG